MKAADAAVLEALLKDVLTPERLSSLVQHVLARAAAEKEAPDAARGSLEHQLADVEAALQRLSEAVAAGGDVPSLG